MDNQELERQWKEIDERYPMLLSNDKNDEEGLRSYSFVNMSGDTISFQVKFAGYKGEDRRIVYSMPFMINSLGSYMVQRYISGICQILDSEDFFGGLFEDVKEPDCV